MNKLNSARLASLAILTLTLATGCLDSMIKPESTVTSKVGGSMDELLPPYSGMKARIAVSDFEWKTNTSKTTVGIGGTDFSFKHEDQVAHTDALKAMLSTALVQSKRYRVMERARIDSLKSEIGLQEDGYTDESGKQRGSVKGADILVVAYITGWDPGSSGKSGGISAGLLGKKASSLIGAVSGSVKKSSLSGSGSLGGGLNTYSNTPMEKAIRSSILEATRYIAENTPAEYMVH